MASHSSHLRNMEQHQQHQRQEQEQLHSMQSHDINHDIHHQMNGRSLAAEFTNEQQHPDVELARTAADADSNDQCKFAKAFNTTSLEADAASATAATGIYFGVRAKRDISITSLQFPYFNDLPIQVELYSIDEFVVDETTSSGSLVFDATLSNLDAWQQHTASPIVLNPSNTRKGLIASVHLTDKANRLTIQRGQRKTLYVQIYTPTINPESLSVYRPPVQDTINTGSLWQTSEELELYVGAATTANRRLDSAARRLDQPDLERMTILPRSVFQGTIFAAWDADCPLPATVSQLTETLWAGQTFGVDTNAMLPDIDQAIFDAISTTIFDSDVQLKAFTDSKHIQLKLDSVQSTYKATNNVCDSAFQAFFANGCQVIDVAMTFTHIPGLLNSKTLELEILKALTTNLQLTQTRLRSNHGVIYLPTTVPLSQSFTLACKGVPSSTILNPIQRMYVEDTLAQFFQQIAGPVVYDVRIESQITTGRRRLRGLQADDRPTAVLQLATLITGVGDNSTFDAYVASLQSAFQTYESELLDQLARNHYLPGPVNRDGTDFGAIFSSLFGVTTSITKIVQGGDPVDSGDTPSSSSSSGGTSQDDIIVIVCAIVLAISTLYLLYRFATDFLLVGNNNRFERKRIKKKKKKKRSKSRDKSRRPSSSQHDIADDDDEERRRDDVTVASSDRRRRARRSKSSDRLRPAEKFDDEHSASNKDTSKKKEMDGSERTSSESTEPPEKKRSKKKGGKKGGKKSGGKKNGGSKKKKKKKDGDAKKGDSDKAPESAPDLEQSKGNTDDDKPSEDKDKDDSNSSSGSNHDKDRVPDSPAKLKRSNSGSLGNNDDRKPSRMPSWSEFVAGGKSAKALFDGSEKEEDDTSARSSDQDHDDDDKQKSQRSSSREVSSKPSRGIRRSSSFDNFRRTSESDHGQSRSSSREPASRNGRGTPTKPKRRPSLSSVASAPYDPERNRAGDKGRGMSRAKSMDDNFFDNRSTASGRRGGRRNETARNRSGENGRGIGRSKSMDAENVRRDARSSSRDASRHDDRRRDKGVGRTKSMDADFFGSRSDGSRNRAGENGRGVNRTRSYDAERYSSSASTSSGDRRRGGTPSRSSSLMDTPSARVNQLGQLEEIRQDPKRGVTRSRSMDPEEHAKRGSFSRTQSVRSNHTSNQYYDSNHDDNRSRTNRSDMSPGSKRGKKPTMRNRDDRSTSGRSRDGRSEKGYRSKNDARINKSSQRSSTEGRPPTTGRRDKAGRTNKSNHSSGGASVASARSRASRATSVRHDTRTGRMVFEAKGRKIYEFEQTDKDITIYIGAPSFVKSTSELSCNITKTHLQLGLAGSSKWFIDENTFGPVDISKSSWNLGQESGSNVIFVYLRKYNRGDHWETALHGKSKGTVRPAKKRDS